MHQCDANKNVFKQCLTVSLLTAASQFQSSRELHTDGPASNGTAVQLGAEPVQTAEPLTEGEGGRGAQGPHHGVKRPHMAVKGLT